MALNANAVDIALNDLYRKSRNDDYMWNPALWATEVLGAELWSMQIEMLESVAKHKRTIVKSCHSSGKSYTMGILACWWVCTRGFQSLVVSTAPTYSQVHSILWNEIRRHWGEAELPGDVTQGDQWNLSDRRKDGKERREMVAFGRRPADHDTAAFSGLHRDGGVLFLMDEAVGIPDSIFTAAQVNTTAPHDRVFAIANPDDMQTPFGRVFEKDDPTWNKITISAYSTPNFTGEIENMSPGMEKHFPQVQWVEDMKIQWGEDSSRFKAKILAEFPDQSDFMFFTQHDIDAGTDFSPNEYAEDHLVHMDERPVLGMDVARFGDDYSTIYKRDGAFVELYSKWSKTDLVASSRVAREAVIETDARELRIDGTGLGAGVVDIVMNDEKFPHDRCRVISMMGSAAAKDPFKNANARAERHNELKTGMINGTIKIDPNNTELIEEMKSVRFSFNGKMAVQIEAKVDMKKRGAKSPDHLDAVTYAVADVSHLFETDLVGTTSVDAQEFTDVDYDSPIFRALEW